jgi:hypothetical protein
MRRTITAAAVAVLVLATITHAGLNLGVKVGVHVMDHASRSCAKAATMPVINKCEDIVPTHAGVNVDAFPVFFDMTEYQGFDYGLTWEGGASGVFTSCSDLTIGGIVNSGDGVSHAWTLCQNDSLAIPGFIWLYSYGQVCVVENPAAGFLIAGDCSGAKDTLVLDLSSACAGTNGVTGENPCLLPATEPTSWGSIKSMFK